MGTKRNAGTEPVMKLKLCKYKALRDFEHVADIIVNKRFYAAPYGEFKAEFRGRHTYFAGELSMLSSDLPRSCRS